MFRTGPASERKPHGSSSSGLLVEKHSTSRNRGGAGGAGGAKRYPFRLNFYDRPPVEEITVEEFESWAIDRLRVLAEIEASSARNRPYAELKEVVSAQCRKHLPLSASTASARTDLEGERRKDHVAHFVLRLAFCRSEELRRRFVKAETMLFRLRFETDDAMERELFLRTLNFDWEPVSAEEKMQYREQILAASPNLAANFESESFFKVQWTRVTDLVEKRRVFLKAGTAWVPLREQASLVLAEFQSRLSKDLESTARALPRLDEDDRLLPVLSHLSLGFLAGVSSEYTSSFAGENGAHITADMVDALVKRHAPMCMRHLHDSLQHNKHLRHYGRLQYNLFLKEIGLPIEEALVFWRRSFANMTDDKFNKEYRYNIRHGYGLEGRRLNYPAKSCARILTQDQPGPQDSHGCPFRHFSLPNLSSALSSTYGLSSTDQSEILSAVKAGHYHVGCTRLFEITHRDRGVKRGEGLGSGESVDHPNKYFERSWSIERGAGKEGDGKPDSRSRSQELDAGAGAAHERMVVDDDEREREQEEEQGPTILTTETVTATATATATMEVRA